MMAGPLGFEPRQLVLETTVLPLTTKPYGCGGWDSNPRSLGYEPNDLATGLPRNKLVGGDGFEPSKAEPADLQSAPFSHSGILRHNKKSYTAYFLLISS